MKNRVLVIEDEKEISLIMKLRLQSLGYEVLQAFDGEEGLKCAREAGPDLIVLDLVLPKVSGMQIIQALKNDDKYKSIPVVVVTGLTQDNQDIRAMVERAEAYFLKPFDFVELTTMIADLLNNPKENFKS